MGKKVTIGKVTVDQQLKSIKKENREVELEENGGWKAVHKIHKSNKTYSRKTKHKNQ